MVPPVTAGPTQITEVLWIVFAIPGMIAWIYNLRHAMKVYRLALTAANALEIFWARANILTMSVFLYAEISILGLGIFGATKVPPAVRITPLSWSITFVLVTLSIGILAAGLVCAHSTRVLTLSAIARAEEETNPID